MERLGILSAAALIIAVMGLWNFLLRTWTERHRDNPFAQGLARFY